MPVWSLSAAFSMLCPSRPATRLPDGRLVPQGGAEPGGSEGTEDADPGLRRESDGHNGVNVQTLAAAEIYPALERGVIDATEWVGPYDDEKLGFYRVAKYYYSPGWWEPGPQLSALINLDAYNKLPKQYREALQVAAAMANVDLMAHYDAVNAAALTRLKGKGVRMRKFSDEIMGEAEKNTFAMYDDLAAEDKTWNKVYGQWKEFRESNYAWFTVAEQAFSDFAFPKAT